MIRINLRDVAFVLIKGAGLDWRLMDMIQSEILDKDKHIELLTETNRALADKLSFLNKRMMVKNDEQAKKWQSKAFYWKRKYLDAIERLTTHQQGENNGKVCDTNTEKTGCGD